MSPGAWRAPSLDRASSLMKRDAKTLEHSIAQVMFVVACDLSHVQREAGVDRNRIEEFFYALRRDVAKLFALKRDIEMELPSPTYIDGHEHERVIHNHVKAGKSNDRVFENSLLDRAAQANAYVLNGVVVIDVQIAFRVNSKINLSVKSELQ